MFRYLKCKSKEIKSFNQKAKLISITVGKKPSEAEYYVNNAKDVQELINKLTLKIAKSVSTFDIKKAALASQFQMEQELEEEKKKKKKIKHAFMIFNLILFIDIKINIIFIKK